MQTFNMHTESFD